MSLIKLSFESQEDSLSVRSFAVREAISTLFEVSVVARSPNDDLDLESIVGQPASLHIASGMKHANHSDRRWSGVCNFMEQEQAEETGLSTYHLRIVPTLWLLTQRRNHRIFQHLSAPEIVHRFLEEWGIHAVWRVDRAHHPKLEYRVQYGESDFAFLCRILEEAGISFTFADEDRGSVLHFHDAPQSAEPRAGGPIRYVDQPNQAAEQELVTKVKISHEVRPGKVTIRAHDFRRKADYALIGEAAAPSPEARLEQFHYQHGAFVVEGHKGSDTPLADDKGVARADEKVGKARAEKQLAGERASRRRVAFQTNAIDLRPGVVFAIGHHVRSDLDGDAKLLVTEMSFEGAHGGEWTVKGGAVFAAHPYHPPKRAEKPAVHGVESAVVVGPQGQEIHTDEFGRVRVQFPWDREGTYEHSSCWMRVSQGWAGGGFGMMAIPRVGQEVLVGFFQGDPDQPVVVGRVFNNTTRVPYKLPEHKTRSTWKSDSSPGSGGFNEIMFEDASGGELVSIHAERDMETTINNTDTINVGVSRRTQVGTTDDTVVGDRHSITIAHSAPEPDAPVTRIEMTQSKIVLTTGEARLVLEGPNITFDAPGTFVVKAAGHVRVESAAGDVVVQGGPIVRINPRGAGEHPDAPGGAIPFDLADGESAGAFDDFIAEVSEHAWFNPSSPNYLDAEMSPGGRLDPTPRGEKEDELRAFRYAVAGRCLGLPEGVLLRRAGALNLKVHGPSAGKGDPGNGVFRGEAPYGNSEHQFAAIQKGFAFYDKQYTEAD